MLNYDTDRLNSIQNDEFLSYALEECIRLSENEIIEIPNLEKLFTLGNNPIKDQMKIGKNARKILNTLINWNKAGDRRCPHCSGNDLSRYGKHKGRQRYKCRKKTCGRTFTDITQTVFASSKKSLETWFRYIILMFSGATLRKISRELDINIQTAFNWRHKIIKVLKKYTTNRRIGGIVQIGEVKFCERWGEFRGERRPEIIYTAVDHTGRIIADLVYEKEDKIKEFKRILSDKLEDGTYVVRPQNRHFIRYLKDVQKNMMRNLEVMSWSNSIEGLNCFRIAKVNLNIKFLLAKFRGIKMKYLQGYLNWFMWCNDSCLKHGEVDAEDILNILI